MSEDEAEKMRVEIAQTRGFILGEVYTEKQACGFIKKDPTTVKRWRNQGFTDAFKIGPKNWFYRGRSIADLILFGKRSNAWQGTQSENSKSANTGSPNGKAVPHGTAPGSMVEPPDVHHLAQTMFKKPSGA